MSQHYAERPRACLISQTTAGLVPPISARLAVAADERSLPIWLSKSCFSKPASLQRSLITSDFCSASRTFTRLPLPHWKRFLRAWSGLGYYSRARNLQKAAQQIVAKHGGQFPARLQDALALPGIGNYTAAAILSIVFGEKYAVLDGNVARVLTRLAAIRGDLRESSRWQELQKTADRLLDRESPGDWNQSMMELGATLCTPKSPQCLLCPSRNSVKRGNSASPNLCLKNARNAPLWKSLWPPQYSRTKKANPPVASAEEYKGENLGRSCPDAGVKNVAFPNAIGGCGTSREAPRFSTKTDAGGSKTQMATYPGRQSSPRGHIPRHHPITFSHSRKKTSKLPRREAGSAQRYLRPARFQPHEESRTLGFAAASVPAKN